MAKTAKKLSRTKHDKPATKKRAAAKKKAAPVAATTAAPRSDGARQVIGEKHLKDLARLSDQCMSRASEASGQLGQAIRDYQEKGLDPIAFRMVNRLRRLGQRDPLKLRGVLDNFEHYSDVLGLGDMAASQLDLGDKPKPRGRKEKNTETDETDDGQIDLSERADLSAGDTDTTNVTNLRESAEAA